MIKEIWCAGCNEVKGEFTEEMQKLVTQLGCCPKCETQWVLRDKNWYISSDFEKGIFE